MTDLPFIDRCIEVFGSARELANAVSERAIPITQSAVYQWKRRGVAPKLRPVLARIAQERGIPVPRGFAKKRPERAAQ